MTTGERVPTAVDPSASRDGAVISPERLHPGARGARARPRAVHRAGCGGVPWPRAARLSLGVAARLSRYLQVLTQAKKMGKETISSRELSDYTHVNPTQIRRDFSGFGKFGKRGVGYNVDALVSEIRKILRTAGQHNIALFGAGRLGQASAESGVFADHGFNIAAVFDTDPAKVGTRTGDVEVHALDELDELVRDKNIIVGVLAVPDGAAQGVADRLIASGV